MSNAGASGSDSAGAAGVAGNTGAAGSGNAGASGAGNAGAAGAAGKAGAAGSGNAGSAGSAGKSGSGGAGGGAGAAGSAGVSGNAGVSGAAGMSGAAGAAGMSGAAGAGGGTAGNPDGSCSSGIPARGQPASTANPTSVVGSGSADSCTFGLLNTAVTKGGVITFNCGSAPVTIAVTATMKLPINKTTVIDGGNKITLDGGQAVQILRFDSANYQANENSLTLQHITLTNGKTTPTQVIPPADPPCSQGYDDGEGGALYMRDGNLNVIDSIFTNNQGAPLGPDTGGGAIYILGSKHGATIVSSTFLNNSASNAGGVGGLQSELDIYNSLFSGNKAVGHDANGDQPKLCSVINNNQNETGSGGNGGAIYSDGESVNLTLCGNKIVNNAAGVNAFGGGVFFTSNDFGGALSIKDTTMTGNTGGHWTSVSTGSTTNAGTAVGTNALSLTIVNSTLQGVP
jgi:hypothetical protein